MLSAFTKFALVAAVLALLIQQVWRRPSALTKPVDLPLSYADVPITPKLADAYARMQELYGMDFVDLLDIKLQRRAALAQCAITTPGAAAFVVVGDLSFDHSSRVVRELTHVKTTYGGAMDTVVRACLESQIVAGHPVTKFMAHAPDWYDAEHTAQMLDSTSGEEIDIVRFPIEQDELYRFFDGDVAAYRGTATWAQFFR